MRGMDLDRGDPWLMPDYRAAVEREVDRLNERMTERPKGNMRDKSVYVEEMTTPTASIVVLHVDYMKFEGTARAHPDDRPGNPSIGRQLALSRAFKKAGRYYRKRAEEELKWHEEREQPRGRGFARRNPYDDNPL